jgi:hypothetical protein
MILSFCNVSYDCFAMYPSALYFVHHISKKIVFLSQSSECASAPFISLPNCFFNTVCYDYTAFAPPPPAIPPLHPRPGHTGKPFPTLNFFKVVFSFSLIYFAKTVHAYFTMYLIINEIAVVHPQMFSCHLV